MRCASCVLIACLTICGVGEAGTSGFFEGRIEYRIEVEPFDDRVTPEWIAQRGTAMTLFIGGGNYKQIWHNSKGDWEMYRHDENAMYTKLHAKDVLFVADVGVEKRELRRFSVADSPLTILGRATRVATVEYVDGTVSRYWFDPSLKIDPTPFERLRFAYLNRYWAEARSPILKHERSSSLFRMSQTATKIEAGPLPAGIFDIPELPREHWE